MTRTPALAAALALAVLTPTPVSAQESGTPAASTSPTPSASPSGGPDYCDRPFGGRSTHAVDRSSVVAGDLVTYTVTIHGPVNRIEFSPAGYSWTTPTVRGQVPYVSRPPHESGALAPDESRTYTSTARLTGNTRFGWRGAVYCGPGRFHGDVYSDGPVVNVAPRLTITAVRDRPRVYTFSGAASRDGQLLSLYRVGADGAEVLTARTRAGAGAWSLQRRFLGSGRFGFVVRSGGDMANVPGASTVRPTVVH